LGTLRIIAGTLRGRRIRVPSGLAIRPTPDRVREALFSILGGDLDSLTVLDAYAGTGALGFEALSRGASRATFIEADARARNALQRNAADLGVEDRCSLVPGRVESVIPDAVPGRPFDLVLADPPYGSGSAEPLLEALLHPGMLAAGARVVFQRDRETPAVTPDGPGLALARTAAYGRTCLDFYTVSRPDI
jgi:16S rRNA (guanine(966)-N(2))-methyltransferase RsmD